MFYKNNVAKITQLETDIFNKNDKDDNMIMMWYKEEHVFPQKKKRWKTQENKRKPTATDGGIT